MACENASKLISLIFPSQTGGDWGSLIGVNMATLFPENVLGEYSREMRDEMRIFD
jgi:hypothetical protein